MNANPRVRSPGTFAKMSVSTPASLVVVVLLIVVVVAVVDVAVVAVVLVVVTVEVVGNTGCPGKTPMSEKMNSASGPESTTSPDRIFSFRAVRAACHSV